jgi:hypothetical protein
MGTKRNAVRQVVVPIPGRSESTACDLLVPEIRKDFVLPCELQFKAQRALTNTCPPQPAKKSQIALSFRTRHARQVNTHSVFSLYMRPFTLPLY